MYFKTITCFASVAATANDRRYPPESRNLQATQGKGNPEDRLASLASPEACTEDTTAATVAVHTSTASYTAVGTNPWPFNTAEPSWQLPYTSPASIDRRHWVLSPDQASGTPYRPLLPFASSTATEAQAEANKEAEAAKHTATASSSTTIAASPLSPPRPPTLPYASLQPY